MHDLPLARERYDKILIGLFFLNVCFCLNTTSKTNTLTPHRLVNKAIYYITHYEVIYTLHKHCQSKAIVFYGIYAGLIFNLGLVI